MLCTLDSLRRLQLGATDGDIGLVRDVLFDDKDWAVRYLAANAGQWMFGKRVLIGVEALGRPALHTLTLPVAMRIQDVREQPEVDEVPVTRLREVALRQHHGWPAYWGKALAEEGIPAIPEGDGRTLTTGPEAQAVLGMDPTAQAAVLFSVRELEGFAVADRDGAFGTLADAVIDVEGWTIAYWIIDTPAAGRRTLVSPQWTAGVDRVGRMVRLNLDRTRTTQAPTADVGQDGLLRAAPQGIQPPA